MRIVNVNKFYYLRGGAERYFFSLAELLTTHGHEVIPFSMQHPLNLRTPYEKYFPSYVEFGRPEPIDRSAAFPPADLSGGVDGPRTFCSLSRISKLLGCSIQWRWQKVRGGRFAKRRRGESAAPIGIGEREGASPAEHGDLPRHRSVSPAREAAELSSLNILRVLGRMFWSREVAKKFDALLSDTKPNLVHLHNIYHQLSPSLLPVAKRHKLPVVMTVHDYKLVWPDYLLCGYPTSPRDLTPALSYEEREIHRVGGYWNVVRERCTHGSYAKSLLVYLEWRFHQWLRVYEKYIDLFLAPSEFVRERLVAGGYDAKKIRVLPHFVTESKKSAISNPQSSILYFGRLSKEKGVDILLQIMQTLGPDVELRIVGEGPEEKHLRLQIADCRLQNVTFLGRLDAEELTKEIDRAALIVVPSVAPETFGYTILESFAHGKPVVASRIGAFPELVRDGETGFLVPPHDVSAFTDRVRYLLSHSKERVAMGKRARAIAQTYSPKRHYAEIIHLYQQL